MDKHKLLILVLLIIPTVAAYVPTETIPLAMQMDYNNGTGPITGCSFNFSVYYGNGTHIKNYPGTEIRPGVYQNESLKLNRSGSYFALANCTLGSSVYVGSIPFEIGGEDNMIISALIIIPIIFGIILIIAAGSMDPEHHAVFKIFLFLLAFMCFWISLYIGGVAVAKFYDFAGMQTAITTTLWIMGIIFFVIVSYYSIYMTRIAFRQAAQETEDTHIKY